MQGGFSGAKCDSRQVDPAREWLCRRLTGLFCWLLFRRAGLKPCDRRRRFVPTWLRSRRCRRPTDVCWSRIGPLCGLRLKIAPDSASSDDLRSGGIKNQVCRADGNAGWAETVRGSIYHERPLTNTGRHRTIPGLESGGEDFNNSVSQVGLESNHVSLAISGLIWFFWCCRRCSSIGFMLHGICLKMQEERSGLLIDSSKVGSELQRKGKKHRVMQVEIVSDLPGL